MLFGKFYGKKIFLIDCIISLFPMARVDCKVYSYIRQKQIQWIKYYLEHQSVSSAKDFTQRSPLT